MDVRAQTDREDPERPRLLVVEDEVVLGRALGAYFEMHGYQVVRARSLREAGQALDAADFDAAVLDVGLPDGDGLSLLSRADPRRVVVISAAPDLSRYARRGVRHHQPKPLDLVELERQVRAAAEAAAAASTAR